MKNNQKYLVYTAKKSHNNRKKINIYVRPKIDEMAANIYIISLMSKSFL